MIFALLVRSTDCRCIIYCFRKNGRPKELKTQQPRFPFTGTILQPSTFAISYPPNHTQIHQQCSTLQDLPGNWKLLALLLPLDFCYPLTKFNGPCLRSTLTVGELLGHQDIPCMRRHTDKKKTVSPACVAQWLQQGVDFCKCLFSTKVGKRTTCKSWIRAIKGWIGEFCEFSCHDDLGFPVAGPCPAVSSCWPPS